MLGRVVPGRSRLTGLACGCEPDLGFLEPLHGLSRHPPHPVGDLGLYDADGNTRDMKVAEIAGQDGGRPGPGPCGGADLHGMLPRRGWQLNARPLPGDRRVQIEIVLQHPPPHYFQLRGPGEGVQKRLVHRVNLQ